MAVARFLVAATAERHRVCVLHDDADSALIAELSGHPVRWAVPRGSVT